MVEIEVEEEPRVAELDHCWRAGEEQVLVWQLPAHSDWWLERICIVDELPDSDCR
jgi:hypothetical protein